MTVNTEGSAGLPCELDGLVQTSVNHTAALPHSGTRQGGHTATPQCNDGSRAQGEDDERESLVNDRRRGPANQITPKVQEVASIHAFMIDLDCGILDPTIVGQECVDSPARLYSDHVQHWLDRDPVLRKAEVRDSGHGLHVLLWLDEPIICTGREAVDWHEVAKGIRNVLPGDPSLNGIIALTRPIGALNTKREPKTVQMLRAGESITQAEILDLNRRVTHQSSRLWMTLFFGGERVSPCPLCGKGSLGVAGYWQCRCYQCGRVDAASIIYRFYSPKFLASRMEGHHG
jgi:hypothetical protein